MRVRSLTVWALSAASCLVSASFVSAASHPQERRGFWISGGGLMGSASATCDECGGGDREFSTTSYLRLGGTLSDRVLIGGDFNLWWKQQEGVTLNLYNATATLTFYPQASSGFFLKGGVGAGFIDTEFREGSSTITVSLGTGLGVLAGAGYDLRLWKNVSFTPAVNFWAGWSGDVSFLGTTESNNWKHNVVDLSIGITLH